VGEGRTRTYRDEQGRAGRRGRARFVWLGGAWWEVRVVPRGRLPKDYGQCLPDRRRLEVRQGLTTRLRLDTALHEGLHACRPELAEEAVEVTASELAELVLLLFPEIEGTDR